MKGVQKAGSKVFQVLKKCLGPISEVVAHLGGKVAGSIKGFVGKGIGAMKAQTVDKLLKAMEGMGEKGFEKLASDMDSAMRAAATNMQEAKGWFMKQYGKFCRSGAACDTQELRDAIAKHGTQKDLDSFDKYQKLQRGMEDNAAEMAAAREIKAVGLGVALLNRSWTINTRAIYVPDKQRRV